MIETYDVIGFITDEEIVLIYSSYINLDMVQSSKAAKIYRCIKYIVHVYL